MWGSRRDRDEQMVVCIACGDSVERADAREYDKEGDRWDRLGKEFEYLCNGCHSRLCHQPRDGLESLLVSIESDSPRPADESAEHERSTQERFLSQYIAAVQEQDRDR